MNCTPHRMRVVLHPLTALPQVDFPLLLFCLQPLCTQKIRRHKIIKHNSLLAPDDVTSCQTCLIQRRIPELTYNNGWYNFHTLCEVSTFSQCLYNVLERLEIHFQIDCLVIIITINTTHIAFCLLAPRPRPRKLFLYFKERWFHFPRPARMEPRTVHRSLICFKTGKWDCVGTC